MPVAGFGDCLPSFQCRFVDVFNAGSVWAEVPGAGVGILESGLLPAAIVLEGALHRVGVVERGGVEE